MPKAPSFFSFVGIIILGLHLFASTPRVYAVGSTGENNPTAEEMAQTIERQQEQLIYLGDKLAELSQQKATLQPTEEVTEAHNQWLLSYYSAQKQQNETIRSLLKQQVDLFEYQRFASYSLLWLVMAVCVAGVLFSGYELSKSSRIVRDNPSKKDSNAENGADENSQKPMNKISISATGVQVTSAVTGVTVLVISLGFLYLFLDKVYKIEGTRVPNLAEKLETPPGEKQ